MLARELPADDLDSPCGLARGARQFFDAVCRDMPRFDGRFVLIAHVLPSLPPFMEAVESVGDIACVIPKPKSVDPSVLRWVGVRADVVSLHRNDFRNSDLIARELGPILGSRRFIVLDIGGYFAHCINDLHTAMPGQCVGVVEDTENGHRRYEAEALEVPCISVARSPLKRPEDRRVGQAIVFSSEAILRSVGVTLPGQTALVIGYGKIGQSIASELHARHVQVLVADRDPRQAVIAGSDGFTPIDKLRGLASASLIYCATGNHAIVGEEWDAVARDSFVVSVTSADDEFDLSYLAKYEMMKWAGDITVYACHGHRFFLLADGNAVNFARSAEVRPFVHLVQAGLIAAANRLRCDPPLGPGIWSLDKVTEQRLAACYLASFWGAPTAPTASPSRRSVASAPSWGSTAHPLRPRSGSPAGA